MRTLFRQFVAVEGNLGKFAVKLDKTNAWIDAEDAWFASGNYGTSLTSAETYVSAYQSYQSQLEHFKQVPPVLLLFHPLLVCNLSHLHSASGACYPD